MVDKLIAYIHIADALVEVLNEAIDDPQREVLLISYGNVERLAILIEATGVKVTPKEAVKHLKAVKDGKKED